MHTAEGMGTNKKVAKRNAAENMLELLGFKVPQPQPPKPALKTEEKVTGRIWAMCGFILNLKDGWAILEILIGPVPRRVFFWVNSTSSGPPIMACISVMKTQGLSCPTQETTLVVFVLIFERMRKRCKKLKRLEVNIIITVGREEPNISIWFSILPYDPKYLGFTILLNLQLAKEGSLFTMTM